MVWVQSKGLVIRHVWEVVLGVWSVLGLIELLLPVLVPSPCELSAEHHLSQLCASPEMASWDYDPAASSRPVNV